MTAPMTQAQELHEKVMQIEQALIDNNPNLPVMLRTIHTALRNDHTAVTLLSEEEVCTLVSGLMKVTATNIATSAAASKPKKAMKNMTEEDI